MVSRYYIDTVFQSGTLPHLIAPLYANGGIILTTRHYVDILTDDDMPYPVTVLFISNIWRGWPELGRSRQCHE